MDILGELATFVSVSEEVGQDGDDRSDDLEGDMPARASDLVDKYDIPQE